MRRLALVLGTLGVLTIALAGYGRATTDVCLVGAAEGSSGMTSLAWWPPGAVECRWTGPDGTTTGWTTAPSALWVVYGLVLAGGALITRIVRQ